MDTKSVKEKSRKKFQSDASRYERTSDGKFCSRVYPSILGEVNKIHNQTILDIGCGTGIILSSIKEGNFLYGLDISEAMIEEAKKRLPIEANLVVGDAEILPWQDDFFDTVLCTFSFHHYPQPQNVVREILRVLKKEGRLILADPWLPAPLRQISNWLLQFSEDGDYHEYSRPEISKLLTDQGFHMLSFCYPTKDTFLLVAEK
jgi:ubiquinone/menaquinone biosynthesis C-methylase UbiE